MERELSSKKGAMGFSFPGGEMISWDVKFYDNLRGLLSARKFMPVGTPFFPLMSGRGKLNGGVATGKNLFRKRILSLI
jgi:hypothetical protein